MSLANPFATARRVIVRETLGAVVRAKAARADNQEKIAELLEVARSGDPRPLTRENFIDFGRDLDIDPAKIHALADTETSGRGYEPTGRVIPAIEVHAFSDATNHAFDLTNPNLSWPEWIPYKKGEKPPGGLPLHPYLMSYDDRWGLWSAQAELSIEGACCGLSLGRFQQLIGRTPLMRRQGFQPHWKTLGFPSAEALFRKLCKSEFDQFEVFATFMRAFGALPAWRAGNWQAVTRIYNGPGQVETYTAKALGHYKRVARYYA
jgi:hypothetical protein